MRTTNEKSTTIENNLRKAQTDDMKKKPVTPIWLVKLRQLMSLPKMTQTKLAKVLGTSPPTLGRVLKGREPKLKLYLAIEKLHAEPLE